MKATIARLCGRIFSCKIPAPPTHEFPGLITTPTALAELVAQLTPLDRLGLDTEADSPRVFVYDNYPGGIGFSEPLFRMHHELLEATRRLIAECDCENGCTGCVGPIGNTGPLAKPAALRILDLLLANQLAA